MLIQMKSQKRSKVGYFRFQLEELEFVDHGATIDFIHRNADGSDPRIIATGAVRTRVDDVATCVFVDLDRIREVNSAVMAFSDMATRRGGQIIARWMKEDFDEAEQEWNAAMACWYTPQHQQRDQAAARKLVEMAHA